ncbi:MAG: zinc ribbon domain-containing protein [Candidatus Sulfotelmatobacter sp.]
MPYYGFFSHACNRPFSKTLPPIEHNKGKVVCPGCGSEEGERKWFYLAAAKQGA